MRPPVIRILRDATGLRLVIDPARVEHGYDGASIQLSPLEESYLAKDLAEAYAARVFADPATFKR